MFVDIQWRGGTPLRLECAWVGAADATGPVIVFLHEGLGSVAMWKDFPHQLSVASGRRGFVFSRYGYGRSTPRPRDERWTPGFMQEQADAMLPRLFAAVGIERPVLFGHSDGGSIALLYAARHDVAGVVAVAPHLFVEDISIASIQEARRAYEQGDLRERLARYHDDVDSAFYGWNDAWLSPAFRDWNVERDIETIACPVLSIQGIDDEYGSLAQVRAIGARVAGGRVVELDDCGHSPHRDCPEALITHAGPFIAALAA